MTIKIQKKFKKDIEHADYLQLVKFLSIYYPEALEEYNGSERAKRQIIYT